MRYRLCESCGLYFEQGKAYCKLCGHPLAQSTLSEPAKACPRCHLLHGAVSHRCAFCGGELRALREAPAGVPAVRRSRPLLSAAWMDWKVLAALAVVPILVLTAAFLALQPGGSPPLPGRAPAVQGAAAEAERLNAEGIAAARAGRFAEAERAFLAALEAEPDSPKARNNLGILYRRLGRTEEAVVMYEQAIALDPTNPVPYKNLGLIYEEQGRRAEALRHFERYRTLRPDAPDADEIARKIARLRRA
ncbi:MAG: tetratricopeptide repeat protein [candidate division NC10 bacterium]|nr:tetratricopeptide repeat protein [candidate division NC10 bacterium]